MVGVVTAVTSLSVDAVVSTVNSVIVIVFPTFPASSVTVIVQSEKVVLSAKVLVLEPFKVTVLLPEVADVVLVDHDLHRL